MFAFLIAPQRFIFNPLARRDRHMLRQQAQARPLALRLLPYLLLIPFLILAFLPTQIYFTRDQLPLLWLITASSVFYSMTVGLQTLLLAGHLMAREQGAGHWEQLILTKMDARQIVLSKWCAVLPAVWHWHMLSALTRLGVALGFAQLFHHDFGPHQECPFGTQMFCHISHNSIESSLVMAIHFAWWKYVLAGAVLVGFALVEAYLVSAIGVLSALLARRSSLKRLVIGIILRGILIVLGVGFLIASEYSREITLRARANPYNLSANQCWNPCFNWKLMLETVDMGGLSLADGGTASTISILRPTGSRIFVLRQLFAATLGMSLYLMLIWLTLRMAVWVAVQQRALRPGYI